MTFEELTLNNKEELRQAILELYGRDIAQASVHSSTRNYAFCFSEGSFPAAIRVGIGGQKTREAVMSELMFVDYVRMSVPTVSQPVPSVNNRIAEELDCNEEHYCITMFRKANGDVLPSKYWNNAYYEEIGRVLGKIHHASHEAAELGFHFKRPYWHELIPHSFEEFGEEIPKETREVCDALINKIKAMPQTPETFGMIHGDFGFSNIFSEWENVWVFDFDDCCYGFYLYDIGTLLMGFFHAEDGVSPFTRLENRTHPDGMLAHFRKGYEEFYTLPADHWDLLEDFTAMRTVMAIPILLRTLMGNVHAKAYLKPMYEMMRCEGTYFERMEKAMKLMGK